MNKDQILNLLQNVTHSAKLPSQISFEILEGSLVINVSEKGVIANMQEDSSAFEGWAVVIKAAIPQIKRVVLDWSDPKYTPDKKNAQMAHYNRFLMRAANFRRGYAWFEVTQSRKEEVDKVQSLLDSKTLVVNFPKSSCRPIIDKEKKPEAYLERQLVKLWSNPKSVTDEQLPVGIFKCGVVSKENTLTPRGASQIDLWQLYNNIMHIYELKVKGNESIGIISELMFYVCTIRNIIDGLIYYPDVSKAKDFRHFKEFVSAVNNHDIDKVVGYFTAPKYHPLMEAPQLKDKIKRILNENALGVSFEYKRISNIDL